MACSTVGRNGLVCGNQDRHFCRWTLARPADVQGAEADLVGALEVLEEFVGAQGGVVAGGAPGERG